MCHMIIIYFLLVFQVSLQVFVLYCICISSSIAGICPRWYLSVMSVLGIYVVRFHLLEDKLASGTSESINTVTKNIDFDTLNP